MLKQQTYFSQFWRLRKSEIMVRLLVKTLLLIYRWPSFPRWLSSKESTFQSRRLKFNPWIGKIPWRRKWQPSPVFLPGKSCRLRSLAGCSSWGRKELDTTEHMCVHTLTHLLAVSSRCSKEKEKRSRTFWCLFFQSHSWGFHPHDLITSQLLNLLIPSLWVF